MAWPSLKAGAVAAVLIATLTFASLYYPTARPGLETTSSGPTSSASSFTTTSATTSASRTSMSTTTFKTTTSSASTTFTGPNLMIVIPNGAGIGLFGPNGAYFQPEKVTIFVGTTVTWVNDDNQSHGVQSNNGTFFRQTITINGGTYSFTFSTPGVYTYRCTVHSWMSGEIDVVSR